MLFLSSRGGPRGHENRLAADDTGMGMSEKGRNMILAEEKGVVDCGGGA